MRKHHATTLMVLQKHLYMFLAIHPHWARPKALPRVAATHLPHTVRPMVYATIMGCSPVDPVLTRPGHRPIVLETALQVVEPCQCLAAVTDYIQEHLNSSINIFNCQEQGKFQCGWGDCSTNFTDQTSSTIILRDHQKSAATSLPSKTSNSLAVELGVGLSLGICLLVSLLFSCRQHYRLKRAESATSRRSTKSTERPSDDWQWPLGSGLCPACQGHSHSPPQSVYSAPVRREELPRVPSARRGPALPPTIPTQGHLQALREGSDELHELDGYNCDSNQTRHFV